MSRATTGRINQATGEAGERARAATDYGSCEVGKRLPGTPRSAIRAALRRLWLRSRERQAALKRDSYTCQRCGKKQSRAKGKEVYVSVHHTRGVDWEGVIDLIAERLLQTPDSLVTLCEDCHDATHQ